MGRLLGSTGDEATILELGGRLLGDLVARDGWLPDSMARPSAQRYQQYLLHVDAAGRFSVVSFVWGPGQSTPIHDHQTWGLVGVLRGLERSQRYIAQANGRLVADGPPSLHRPGDVEAIPVLGGGIHQVANALEDGVSVSIHAYGADIGRVQRSTFTLDGHKSTFVSSYDGFLTPEAN